MLPAYSRYVYQNELVKICFQHDIAYVAIKIRFIEQNLKFWNIKRSKFLSDIRYHGYQKWLAAMAYNFLIRNLLIVVLLKINPDQASKVQMNCITDEL